MACLNPDIDYLGSAPTDEEAANIIIQLTHRHNTWHQLQLCSQLLSVEFELN